jgi:methionyl-tRNA synthetase
MSARYLTTTLPYVNADPHIGFALELLQADVLVRSWRQAGDDVFFNTGTDEHGQKIFEAAKKADQEVGAYVDHYAAEFRKLGLALNLDSPTFIRTSDAGHVKAAQEMWRRCAASGDIYEKEYEGLYCVGHEAFITEKELVEGKCPEHGVAPELLKEKNYFFKFSKYEKYLLEYLSSPTTVIPDWRREEAIAFVKGGLVDFSISREKERLSWGVPVPGDDSQVMYVWFDALTNYISTLGWPDEGGNFKKYWVEGQTLQLAGKDQVRFQSLIWQAMLKSAGIKATDTVFYHGFINSGGQKMSKSIGNVINPHELVKKYGTDATRYLLLRHVHPVEDTDVTWERLDEWYTAHLTNGLGNVVARVMKMAETYLERIDIGNYPDLPGIREAIESFEFNHACDLIWQQIAALDGLITTDKPFDLIKTDPEQGRFKIALLVRQLNAIARALAPIMPSTSKTILDAVRENKKPENLFPRLA